MGIDDRGYIEAGAGRYINEREPIGDDLEAAIRMAVFRAAAAIGEAMP